ncbi:uncharacterized protein LOC131019017 [Salvia miltiorrhiza]|uniref:uncharacterized protein LOC131019017 n=1 Tax=Salvia miltiorrhiza TaxID=226208 RepID=UPI0025AC5E18|nr:uncharacterized protein LOC131019017 [Salvia miltiorrhiza]
MGMWAEDNWAWRVEWTRGLRGREESQANDLLNLLNNFSLKVGLEDGWIWKRSTNGVYTVKSAYIAIREATGMSDSQTTKKEFASIWKAAAPHKARSTAWRIFKGRLATWDNLHKRQIQVPTAASLCPLCKSHPEDLKHLLFSCSFSMNIWKSILDWLGFQAVLQQSPIEHFLAFTNIGKKEMANFLSSVWICTTWCIWKMRNEFVFNQGKGDIEKMVAEIKSRLWSWSKVYKLGAANSDFRSWVSSPKVLN